MVHGNKKVNDPGQPEDLTCQVESPCAIASHVEYDRNLFIAWGIKVVKEKNKHRQKKVEGVCYWCMCRHQDDKGNQGILCACACACRRNARTPWQGRRSKDKL